MWGEGAGCTDELTELSELLAIAISSAVTAFTPIVKIFALNGAFFNMAAFSVPCLPAALTSPTTNKTIVFCTLERSPLAALKNVDRVHPSAALTFGSSVA